MGVKKPYSNCCTDFRFYLKSKRCKVFSLTVVTIGVLATALFCLYGFSTAKDSDLYSLEIGDVLGNSSSLIEVNSPMSSSVTFHSKEEHYTVLFSDNIPSTIKEHLPLQQYFFYSGQSKVEYRKDFNYLESDEPIYLLPGSSIMYNLTISSLMVQGINASACIYLFTNKTHYNNFLMSVSSSNVIYKDFCCSVVSDITLVAKTESCFFNIVHAGQYYVGIKLKNAYVQASASIARVYYDTNGLQQQATCSSVLICSIDVCNPVVCFNKTTTYFFIKPSFNRTSVNYFFTTPQLHGSFLGGFIATLVLLQIISCCYFLCAFSFYMYQRNRRKHYNQCNSRERHSNDEEPLIHVDLSEIPEAINTCDISVDNEQSDNLTDSLDTMNLTDTKNLIDTMETFPQEIDACQLSTAKAEAALLQSCGSNVCTSLWPQSTVKPSIYWEDSFTIKSDQLCNTASSEKLLVKIKNVFGELHKLSLDRSGLVYHCSQYGVTLIIPEGAVQESATVWFGACLFSDKFKFGDYVPVTPIVWVHIDRKLDKSAELYIPHDVAISSEINVQHFTVLTAHDDDCSDVINFQENYESQFQVSPGLFKILSPHFCSNCVATQKQKYKSIPRRYLIARADKKNGSKKLIIEFIFLCQQKDCKKVVEDQCAKEGLKILSYQPFTFTGDGQVSLSFEPHSVPGWKREEVGFSEDYISIKDIDYYQMMGCENASEVTEDELERLEMLEDLLSYPPRFRIQFTSDAVVEKSEKVIVRFNQVDPPVKNTILLEGSIGLPLSPDLSESTGSTIDLMTYANDSLLGDCLRIIASEGGLKEKWFDFGYIVGLTIGQLNHIELTSIDPIQRTRKVIIQWRNENRSESWEPLAAALAMIGFEDLAHRVKDHFESPPIPPEPEDKDHFNGVYCKLCNKYHLNFEDIQHNIRNADSPPDIVDLVNLVAVKIQDKFYQFGTALHLNDGFLRSLYDTYHNPIDRFIAVFNRWKDNDPDTYTWGTVIKVLQSDAIGAHAVAQDVMKHLSTDAEAAEHASN